MRASGIPAMARLVVAAIVLTLSGAEVLPQVRPGIRPFVTPPEDCSVSEPVDTENVFSFTMAEIRALSFAQSGESARSQALAGGEVVQQMAKTMADLRQARIGNTCAAFIMSPYAGSKNESVATAAKYLAFAYEQLGKMTDETLGITMQASMERKGGTSVRSQISDLQGRRQEIVHNMTEALNVSLSLLLDQSHPDPEGKPDRLILSHAQKLSLLDYLRSQFPSLPKDGVEPSGDFMKQAALIQSFLAHSRTDLGTLTAVPK